MIKITFRKNARNITVRRKADGRLCATVPASIPMTEAEPIIQRLVRQLGQSHTDEWTQWFNKGQVIVSDGLTIRIGTQSRHPDKVICSRTPEGAMIEVGEGLRWGTRELDMTINRMLLVVSRHYAAEILLPLAEQIAAEKGIRPKAWKIGHGHRTLGTCSGNGTVTLSHILVFLPKHLRIYIICHELAHLSEMNHSPRFHAIVDRLTDGHEKELQKSLRTFQWPVIR